MADFGKLYLDKEKDIIVELSMENGGMTYTLRTPNHAKGNLITNLARLCGLPLCTGDDGLKVIRGEVPCYVDERNREIFVLRLADTKVANIYPGGEIERKAYIPAISKTLMSQTKDYRLDVWKTLVKTYIRREYKFRTDLHTHMNANLDGDLLIALGVFHGIRYPLYYVKKLRLRCTEKQLEALEKQRAEVAAGFKSCPLSGKLLTRKIDDNTFINFADLILNNLENAAYNIPRIRASLSILKDGQAVFTNLEKVYLYRYVFTKGLISENKIPLENYKLIPDADISGAIGRMLEDRSKPDYADYSLFESKLLWIARGCRKRGIAYMEISETSLVKPEAAAPMLERIHRVMPAITRETGVTLRFLAALRRIPLTIVRERAASVDYRQQLQTIEAIADDPYIAGSDVVGEEINDIRELKPVLSELVRIAGEHDGFVIRVHAGENDSLRDNVANSLACVREALAEGQKMPDLRIGHGLYTANLNSRKGRKLIEELRESGAVLEFQLTSNVRLNNLTALSHHPLRQYLRGGVYCVQGTDGGAIYGTDSIDEQLALERLLDLSYEDMKAMKAAEDRVLERSMSVFARKMKAFEELAGDREVGELLQKRIDLAVSRDKESIAEDQKLDSAECFREQIRELPTDKVPVAVLGGSFNSSRHATRMKQPLIDLLDELTRRLSPEEVCFVIGSRLTGYERELVRLAGGRFEIFAIVPTRVTPFEARRIKSSGAGVRVSIEPTRMGLYKSFAYEIFKRRPSVVIALDGNSAGANTVQEAKNGKKKARIFVNRNSRVLYAKALALQGYVSVFEGTEAAEKIEKAAHKALAETKKTVFFV